MRQDVENTGRVIVKRGDLVMWSGGDEGNILTGVVLKVEAHSVGWNGEDCPKGFEYATTLWNSGTAARAQRGVKGWR